MPPKLPVTLGAVQETLLVPLYGRAVETGKPNGVIHDPKAVEMVGRIDYDFARLDGEATLFGCALRSAMFDLWIAEFLAEHPDGTVIEIGTGLNTRFERLDNGRVHWVDLDLPDSIQLRREFFADTDRRRMVAASVLDPDWPERARQLGPGPYFLVAEAVLFYLEPALVRQALTRIADEFPGSRLAFDTMHPRGVAVRNERGLLSRMSARLAWGCADPRQVQEWEPRMRLRETRSIGRPPAAVLGRISRRWRIVLWLLTRLLPRDFGGYRLNRYQVG